jgi:hypothetical protein
VNASETYTEPRHINYVLIGSLFDTDQGTVTDSTYLEHVPVLNEFKHYAMKAYGGVDV